MDCIANGQSFLLTTYLGDPQQMGVVEPSDDVMATVVGEDWTVYMWHGDEVSPESVAEALDGEVVPSA